MNTNAHTHTHAVADRYAGYIRKKSKSATGAHRDGAGREQNFGIFPWRPAKKLLFFIHLSHTHTHAHITDDGMQKKTGDDWWLAHLGLVAHTHLLKLP